MNIRKHFLVSALVAGLWNFTMMAMCSWLINVTIPIIMPLRIYTADQFIVIATFLSLGLITFGNLFLIKTGIYDSIRRHIGG